MFLGGVPVLFGCFCGGIVFWGSGGWIALA